MLYKYLSFKILLRYLGLCGLALLLLSLLQVPGYHVTTLVLLLVFGLALLELFRCVSHSHLEIQRVLQAFESGDFSQQIKTYYVDGNFPAVAQALLKVQRHFEQRQQQRAAELSYLQAVVDRVPVPLICLYPDARIELLNSRARQLFLDTVPLTLRDFAQFGTSLPDKIDKLAVGYTAVFNFAFASGEKKLALSATDVSTLGATHRLISLQDIQSQLDKTQLDAWQDLVSVLTHEIINSMTPIASLANTAVELAGDVVNANPHSTDNQSLNDLQQAVTTVARRASNLTQFVDAYRSIARLPEPKFKSLTAADFIERVRLLACQEWPQKHIDIAINIEPSHLTFTADEHMLEQVMINLLNNAEHAVLENPGERRVAIYAGVSQNGEVILSIADNGPAVSKELVRQIFVPFFTTKPRGSGVGLSLSRQILMLHGGRLSYRESDMGGACFDLYF